MQESGKLIYDGELVATGYSGFGAGKNNPRVQHIPNVGPVPVGRYEISRAFDSQADGVVCMHLTPKAGHEHLRPRRLPHSRGVPISRRRCEPGLYRFAASSPAAHRRE
jgi:hypothetical protein